MDRKAPLRTPTQILRHLIRYKGDCRRIGCWAGNNKINSCHCPLMIYKRGYGSYSCTTTDQPETEKVLRNAKNKLEEIRKLRWLEEL